MDDFKKIAARYQQAIEEIDGKLAYQTIHEIENFVVRNNLSQNNPALFQKLKQALIYLKLVGLAFLSDEEVYSIIKEYYLHSFAIDIPMENILTVKLFDVPYLLRDETRKKIKQALSENVQKIGALGIGDWIKEFDKEFNPLTRDFSSSIEFVEKSNTTKKLEPREKEILKKVLHAYDYLLINTLPATGPILDHFLQSSESAASASFSSNYYAAREAQQSTQKETEIVQPQISLLDMDKALESFPEIGEQVITSNRIKILHFPELSKPSVKNWLTDYTFAISKKENGLLTRTDYLFKSPNAANLNPAERDRLNQLLKAYDEKTPLQIDTNNRIIVFTEIAKPQSNIASKTSDLRFSSSKPEIMKPQPKNPTTQSNIYNARFSASQTLPYEKLNLNKQITQQTSLPKTATLKTNDPYQFRVNSFVKSPELKNNPNQISNQKNIINLKDFS